MNLKVSDRLQIQAPARVSSERCLVRLVGYVHGVSLITTAPTNAAGLRLPLIEHEQLVLRVFSVMNAFAFSCSVIRLCKLPFHYLHLSFPSEVQGTVIRAAPRVKTKIPAKVQGAQHDLEDKPAFISNLSANGALLNGWRDLGVKGEQIKVVFHLTVHEMDITLSLGAIIRAVTLVETHDKRIAKIAHFGLEFVDMEPNEHMILQSFIYQQMIKHPETLV